MSLFSKNNKAIEALRSARAEVRFVNPLTVTRKGVDHTYMTLGEWYLDLQSIRSGDAIGAQILKTQLKSLKNAMTAPDWRKFCDTKEYADIKRQADKLSGFAANAASDSIADANLIHRTLMGYDRLIFQPGYTVTGDSDTPEGKKSAGIGVHDFTPEDMALLGSIFTDERSATAGNKRANTGGKNARQRRQARRAEKFAAKTMPMETKADKIIVALQTACDKAETVLTLNREKTI